MLAVLDADGLAIDGGVKLGAVDEIAGVVDGVPLVRNGELAGADLSVDVVEGEGGGLDAKGLAELFLAFEGRDVAELGARFNRDGVERFGAWGAGGESGDFGRELGHSGAGRLCRMGRSGGGMGSGGWFW